MDNNNPADTPPSDAGIQEHPLRILVANEQSTLAVDESRLRAAVRSVLEDSSYESAMISLALVDDPTIHAINRRYLQHDYPTDVLSFVLEDQEGCLEGELIVSADTAQHNAAEYGWSPVDELLLYVVHGALHLVGYGDKQADDVAAMREAESTHLGKLGVSLPANPTRQQEEPKTFHAQGEVRTS